MFRINKEQKKKKGFTLIEALIAILIAAILTTIIAGGITAFSKSNQDRLLKTCLIEGAQTAISACKAGWPINQYDCGKYKVAINLSGNCAPQNGCNKIIVKASVQNHFFELTDMVCKLEQ